MPEEQPARHHGRHRHRHKRSRLRFWLKRLPAKLASKEINIYQVLLAVVLGYLVIWIVGILGIGQGVDAPSP